MTDRRRDLGIAPYAKRGFSLIRPSVRTGVPSPLGEGQRAANSRAYASENGGGMATWELVKNVILAAVLLLLALWEFLLIKNYLKRKKNAA